MVAANQADFLGGGGTVDPFAGLAPAEDPSTSEAARQAQLQRYATQTANTNLDPSGDYGASRQDPNAVTGTPEESDAYMRAHHLGKYARSLGYNLVRDPITMGILAAPAAVTGLGAAIGGGAALGFGAGTGSIAAGAGEPAIYGLPAGIPAAGDAFSMASPFAAGGAGATGSGLIGGVGAAGATAGAASIPGMIGADLAKYGVPAAIAAAPAIINAVAGGRTKEEQALVAKQEQLANEAKVRQGQQQDARMNALGQQLLAFNPTNQMMAQMFGPQSAFTPDQMAQMVQGPTPNWDENLYNYQGTDQKTLAAKREMIRRKNEYDQAEAGRRDMMMGGISPVPQAQPGIQMGAPQAARKY